MTGPTRRARIDVGGDAGNATSAADAYDRIRRLRERRAKGLVSWWRRPDFVDPRVKAVAPRARPKWHIFEAREGRDPLSVYRITYVALCGYEHAFEEASMKLPLVRPTIKTEQLRCSKCEKALADQGGALGPARDRRRR